MSRIPMIALSGVLLALAVAACGGDEKASNTGRNFDDNAATVATNPTPEPQTSTQGEAQERSGVVDVGIENIEFVPEQITAKVGQRIVWTNNEDIPHNVTATEGASFRSGTMRRGDVYEYTPTKAGTIKYVCTIHAGQNGEIRVTE